jgi:hypothetical protein
MVEATHSVHQAQLRARMARAVAVLCHQRAIKEVKARIAGEGRKVAHFSMREIALMAEAYVAQHRPRLIAEARPIVDRWAKEGVFGPRGGIRNPRRRAG